MEDTSIESISFDVDEYKIDINELIDSPGSPSKRRLPEKNKRNSAMTPSKIPVLKKDSIFNVNLSYPDHQRYDTNDLFQVTRKLPKKEPFDDVVNGKKELFDDIAQGGKRGLFDDGFLQGKRLNNDKVDKMVSDLELKYGSTDMFDFEMDDQLRTRFYKGRFNKNQFSIDNNEGLDVLLNNYLDNEPSPFTNENKENEKPKESAIIRNRVLFKTPRKSKSSIPILRPSTSFNLEIKKSEFSVKKDIGPKSPKRICLPRHRGEILSRPAIKYKSSKLNIFIVESLTGLVNDATKFGTELNASNCEDFPLPEDANEIVQIPTNDDPKSKVQKMAIIKVLPNRYFRNEEVEKEKQSVGFYTQHEFENYRERLLEDSSKEFKIGASSKGDTSVTEEGTGVEVVGQSIENIGSRKVRFAEVLEW